MKCDLHVHSIHSGMCTIPVLNKFCRESYNQPAEVYATLKRKGMDLVTLTDHDSIDGAESLRRHPDFFVSEEVTCRMPSGTLAHIGVYDLTERQHIELQRRRDDFASLLAYLSEKRLFFAINHPFSGLTGRRALPDFGFFDEYFPAFEILNAAMPARHNHESRQRARRLGKVGVGGSDAHAIASVGSSYTEVSGARNKSDFFHGLRAGNTRVVGASGHYLKLTREVLWITSEMFWERPLTAVFLPLVPVVPLVTLAVIIHEMAFAQRWSRRLRAASPRPIRRGAPRPADGMLESLA